MKLKPDFYKYVRIGDEFRFAGGIDAQHKALANGEKATSAGSIFVFGDEEAVCWKWAGMYSDSLNVSSAPDDEERLTSLLGVPQKKDPSES
jgi:hypothetical protein